MFKRIKEKHYKLELSLNVIIPPPAHCHRAGFGHRIENDSVRVAPDKIVSRDRRAERHKKLHMHNFIYKQTLCVNFRAVLAKM